MAHCKFSIAEGEIEILYPNVLSQESIKDMEDFFKLVLRAISREIRAREQINAD